MDNSDFLGIKEARLSCVHHVGHEIILTIKKRDYPLKKYSMDTFFSIDILYLNRYLFTQR